LNDFKQFTHHLDERVSWKFYTYKIYDDIAHTMKDSDWNYNKQLIELEDGSFYCGEVDDENAPNGFGLKMSSDFKILMMSYFEDG